MEIPSHHVPNVSSDYTSRADDPNHFCDALHRVGNEDKDQRHDGGVESVCGERKCHGIALTKLSDPRCRPCARIGELSFGWINALDL